MPLLYLTTPEPLTIAAERVFKALSVPAWEERDSSHYPGGTYFSGQVGAIKLRVSRESPQDLFYDEFQVLVLISPVEALQITDEALCELAARELLGAGFRVAREVGSTKQVARWLVYSVDDAGELRETPLERPLPG